MKNKLHLHFRRIRHIHFIGIGGAGMSGIAEVLFRLGYEISGSDVTINKVTKHLADIGLTIFTGHKAEQIKFADVVVVSSAIDHDNVELCAARNKRLPIVPRAEMLGELMRYSYGIAIAGCHGKTTTTSLVTAILKHADLDPTFIIGGILKSCQFNNQLGTGEYMVVEADESDASFLHLLPMISVVTNIDQDHMLTYNNNPAQLKQTYVDFLHNLPFYGLAVVCIDDPMTREVLHQISRPVLTYGFAAEADYRATDIQQKGMQTHFNLHISAPDHKSNHRTDPDKSGQQISATSTCRTVAMQLNLVGEHNVQNALAAIAVADDLGVDIKSIQAALLEFNGVARRFDIRGRYYLYGARVNSADTKPVILIDDYGHHPREIDVTITAAQKSWPGQRMIMLFQPHRYSRTRDLYDAFVATLSRVDQLILIDVYPAGEKPIPGINSQALAVSIRQRFNSDPIYIAGQSCISQIHTLLDNLLQPGDILITQGAGNIHMLSAELEKYLEHRQTYTS